MVEQAQAQRDSVSAVNLDEEAVNLMAYVQTYQANMKVVGTSNAQINAMMHGSMNVSAEKLGKLMQQMATGDRMLMPSDDPISAVRVLRIQREEANLKAASDTMLNVRDMLLWAANGSNTSKDLAAIANELGSLEKTILSFANVRDEEGRYLFSGTLTDRPAITFDPATQTCSLGGNDQYRQAAVANGVLVEENVTAAQVFGTGVDMLNNLNSLIQRLSDPALDSTDPTLHADLKATLDSLDSTHVRLLGSVTELGGRQNTLTLLSSSNEDVSLVNQRIETGLSQLDYASASIDLNNYQLSLQATQKTYLKINGLSLFGML